jgi:hypothetical protein
MLFDTDEAVAKTVLHEAVKIALGPGNERTMMAALKAGSPESVSKMRLNQRGSAPSRQRCRPRTVFIMTAALVHRGDSGDCPG